MITIIIIHTSARAEYLQKSLELLRECHDYANCQKILSVDEACSWCPPEFEVLEVPRPHTRYSLGKCLNAAVTAAKHPKFLYLDDDRIVPRDYLQSVEAAITRRTVVYPAELAWTSGTIQEVRQLRDGGPSHGLVFDPRTKDPTIIRRKTPMSGCMGMMVADYLEFAFDASYEGYGCRDYDHFMKCHRAGFQFVELPARELHLKHPPIMDPYTMSMMVFYNTVKYMKKWGLNLGDPQIVQFGQELGISPSSAAKFPSLGPFMETYHIKML